MRTLLILTLATLVPTVALADREITPLVGLRQGSVEFSTGIGCLTIEGFQCPSFAKSDDSATLGFLIDLPVTDRLDVEVLVNRQPTELLFHDGSIQVPWLAGRGSADFDVTHFQAGLRRTWRIGQVVEPFGAFAAGVTRLESGQLFDDAVGATRASASLAAGARARLSARLGLRFEGRVYRVDLPDEFGPHMTRVGSDGLDQAELTTGLAIRF